MSVTPGLYPFLKYDTFERWASYWHQLRCVALLAPKTVLYIGRGNGLVPEHLRRQGILVECVDLRPESGAEVIADVRSLSEHVRPSSFDVACAFQVLEHLPYEEFVPSIRQLAAVSRSHVLLSLPVAGPSLSLRARWNGRVLAYGTHYGRRPQKLTPAHEWEIRTEGYPLERILGDLRRVVDVQEEFLCPDNPYHHFFICRTRRDEPSSARS